MKHNEEHIFIIRDVTGVLGKPRLGKITHINNTGEDLLYTIEFRRADAKGAREMSGIPKAALYTLEDIERLKQEQEKLKSL